MMHLAYTSTAVDLMDAGDLAQILKEARERNRRRNVTGMLLYRDGTFLQVLEGEEEDVTHVYGLTKSDGRHPDLINVLQDPIEKHHFEDWRMGFHQIEDTDLENAPEGYTPFMEEGFEGETFEETPNRALEMLSYFRGA